ncbi:MAG TPA: SRPBCC family protein [Steroidobacteraceae bacterium]|nr:SRPBCC family protein [Steroidobacteraceae bacterium]
MSAPMHAPASAPSTALPRRRMQSFHLDAPLERVLPLFTARGEREWAPGWDPVMLSGAEQRGSAFRTRNHEGRTTTWIVIDYRPAEGRVSYARLAEGSNIGLVDVVCTATGGGGTDVSVTYTLTALRAEAQTFVDDFLNAVNYARMMEDWRVAVSAALAAGGDAGGR